MEGLPFRFWSASSKSRLLATVRGVGLGLSVSPDGSIAYTVDAKDRTGDLRLVEHFR